MKKVLVLFEVMALVIPLYPTLSQTLLDPYEYISEVRGDTLVIKDYYDMGNQPNSLYWVLTLDTVNVPAGRVYELKANGYYPNWLTPTSSATHPTVIVGEDTNIVVNNKNESSLPPLICNFPFTVDLGSIGITLKGDFTIKNCELIPGDISGNTNWTFAVASAPNLHLVFENCLFEHTLWTFVDINDANCNVTFRDCYFVNMSGYLGRNLGGAFDCFAEQDTLLLENCTHIMAQGDVYSFKGFPFKRIIINHNTFINCTGSAFMNYGYQGKTSLTNNIFVNTNIYPLEVCTPEDLDVGKDPDGLPIGLVNVNPYPADSTDTAPRKFLVLFNLAYWDPLLVDCDSILNASRGNNSTCWKSQAIIMNSRTQDMFDDSYHYPYLYTDTWKTKLPLFTNPQNLLTTQVETLKNFVIESAYDSNAISLPDWRVISTGQNNHINPDWPIPVDLSYTDYDLLNGGIAGYPLGDLNWFPDKKVKWLATRTIEYQNIDYVLNYPPHTDVEQTPSNLPVKFQLQQNYPNPFNPSTVISYRLSEMSNVVLKIYDTLGKEIVTLVNEVKHAGTHFVHFDGSSLASGVYFYRLRVNGYEETRKMVLMR